MHVLIYPSCLPRTLRPVNMYSVGEFSLLIIGSSDQDSEVCDDKALKLYQQIELFGQTGTEF